MADVTNMNMSGAMMVILDVTQWSARCKLTREDLPDNVQLPPDELASLGSKRLFDPEALRPFGKLKTTAYRLIDRVGVRFLPGAWFIDKANWDALSSQLDDVHAKWDAAVDSFVANYDTGCREWAAQFPQWRDILVHAMPDSARVRVKYSFRYLGMTVTPESDETQQAIDGLADAAMEDLLRVANEVWDSTFANRTTRLTAKSLAPVRNLVTKLRAMSFAKPECNILASIMENALTDGAPDDREAALINAILVALCSADGATRLLQMYENVGRDSSALMDSILGVNIFQPEPEPVPEPAAPAVEEVSVPVEPAMSSDLNDLMALL